MDEALQRINKMRVDEETRKIYVQAFVDVYLRFQSILEQTDPLFKTYQKKIHTGSHATKTRVGVPNEFDINICIKLPLTTIAFKNSTRPGYIQIQTSPDDWEELKRKPNWDRYKSMEKWVDGEGYLLGNKIRTWMEGRVQDALTMLGSTKILHTDRGQFKISTRKSGPAFTLIVSQLDGDVNFSVDLVPCIVFKHPNWPCNVQHKYVNKYSNNEWLAVAKPLYDSKEERFFRPSFPDQEREIFNNQSLYHLKSTLRLIKKLRDTNNLTYIATYYINTLFMWKTQNQSELYWQQSLSKIFMDMLSILEDAFTKKCIPCFWIRNHNLLDSLTSYQIQDGSNRLKNIIKNIRAHPEKIEEIILGNSIPVWNDDILDESIPVLRNEENSYCIIL